MQFTSTVDQPSPPTAQPVNKPDLRPSAEFTKRTRTNGTTRGAIAALVSDDANAGEANNKDMLPFLRFPPLFSNNLGAYTLLPLSRIARTTVKGSTPQPLTTGLALSAPPSFILTKFSTM